MAKKPVATVSDVIDTLGRLAEAVERIEKAIGRIEKAVEKDHPASRIVPDKRYTIPELGDLGFKRGFLYKWHRALMRKEHGHIFILGRDVSKINESAPTLAPAPAASTVAVPRRRGRPRKDAKPNSDDTDDRTINNQVVYALRWHRYPRYVRKAA